MNDKFKIMVKGKGGRISNFEVTGNVEVLLMMISAVIFCVADQADLSAIDLIDDIKEYLQCAWLQ